MEVKPTTMDALEEAINDFWRNHLTQEMINKYFDHTIKNVKMVYDQLHIDPFDSLRNQL